MVSSFGAWRAGKGGKRAVDDGFGGKNAVRQIAGNAATVAPLFPVAPAPVLPRDTARAHYHGPDGSYRGWGLHTWLDAAAPTAGCGFDLRAELLERLDDPTVTGVERSRIVEQLAMLDEHAHDDGA